MSGGSLDYAYSRVEDAARTILECCKHPLHIAFGKHLIKVSKALHDLEWEMSGDYSSGQEEESIRKVISSSDEVKSVIEDAEIALKNLENAIKNAVIKG